MEIKLSDTNRVESTEFSRSFLWVFGAVSVNFLEFCAGCKGEELHLRDGLVSISHPQLQV